MGVTQRFQEVIDQRHQYARAWKERTGGKVLGYLCTYVPEEIFYAAGMLPVRIIGSHEPESVTAPYIFGMFCSYCRDCLAQGLLGRYDYLDAVATAHCCVHSFQTFDSWRRHLPIPHSYYVSMPQIVQSRGAKESMARELAFLKDSLEEQGGHRITKKALKQAAAVYNRNRRLMGEVYELRKRDNPPISGAECMEMVMASQLMDKEEHSRLLEELLAELRANPGDGHSGVRLMLVGQTDSVELVRLIESLGATIVMDDLCFGSRYFWNEVKNGRDPLSALAERYVDRPPCPMKDLHGVRIRPKYVLGLAQEYRVQSAILVRQQFCDPHEYDVPAIKRLLEKNGIPGLTLEQDVTIPVGQLSTRIEAHLEMVGQEIA